MLPSTGDLVEGTDEVVRDTTDASTGGEVVEVEFVFDVDGVDEDERVGVGDVEGGEEGGGVVRD